MKVHIDKEEWYPVYTMTNDPKGGVYHPVVELNIEVPDELYKRYKRALDTWNEIQAEIEDYEI